MRFLTRVGVAVLVAAAASQAGAAGNADAGKAKAAVCMACHGQDGNSPAEVWPKIAGQLPEYIEKQLRDFKSGRRSNEQMSPMAQPLSERDIEDLAAFFAAQTPSKVDGAKKELIALGEKIYREGKGRPQVVPACIGCHGPAGGGKSDWAATMKVAPTTLAPAIASQHAAYTAAQLQAFRSKARNNDIARVMRDIAVRLTDAEVAAVAEYVATLGRQ